MTLVSRRNGRKFTIEDSNLRYVISLFSNEVTKTFNTKLIHNLTISNEDCVSMSDTIKVCLFKHNIADLVTDGETIPILNPSVDQYSDNLVDISQPHRKFLFSFAKFLEDSGEIEIE